GFRPASGVRSKTAPDARQEFIGAELEETFLVIIDLAYVDLVHPVLEVRFERGHVHLGIRPTGHHIGDHVLGDQLFGQLLEVAWQRQQLKRLPDQGLGGPTLTGQTPGRTLVVAPADLDATLDRFFGSTPRTEHLHGAAAGPGQDETITGLGSQRGGLGPERGHVNARGLLRQCVQSRGVDAVELPTVGEALTSPEFAHHLKRPLKHRYAPSSRWPDLTEDVFVEGLPRAHTERETPS